jgi:hypothetical protein
MISCPVPLGLLIKLDVMLKALLASESAVMWHWIGRISLVCFPVVASLLLHLRDRLEDCRFGGEPICCCICVTYLSSSCSVSLLKKETMVLATDWTRRRLPGWETATGFGSAGWE